MASGRAHIAPRRPAMARVFPALLAGLLALPAPASAACRLALALGLDISGSVDGREYRLQLDGLAAALLDPEVQEAFFAMPDAWVRVFVFEWGGVDTQRPLIDWQEMRSRNDLAALAGRLRATRRAPHDLSTALGLAMVYGGNALADQADCWRRTLDLSGDGQSNVGPSPQAARRSPALAGVIINGLVIGADAPPFTDKTQSEIAELSAYFRAEVIQGPDAFVETAIEFNQFQDAMTRKLLRELQTRAVGFLGGFPGGFVGGSPDGSSSGRSLAAHRPDRIQ